jgi:hypothetical protein
LIGVGIRYFWRTRANSTGRLGNAGELARNGVRNVLAAGAAMFAVLSVVYLMTAVYSPHPQWGLTALQVYAISALRVVPYLALVVGPLATAAGIAVDVLFYVARTESLSTAAVLRKRFRLALDYATAQGSPIIVAAHSQGTVIAVDVIGGDAPDSRLYFVTAGSPLQTLYEQFLGSTPETLAATAQQSFRQPTRWINFFCDGDYIGGGQKRAGVSEKNLGAGGHTGYWKIPALWHIVLDELSAREPSSAPV